MSPGEPGASASNASASSTSPCRVSASATCAYALRACLCCELSVALNTLSPSSGAAAGEAKSARSRSSQTARDSARSRAVGICDANRRARVDALRSAAASADALRIRSPRRSEESVTTVTSMSGCRRANAAMASRLSRSSDQANATILAPSSRASSAVRP